ncbi:unnamed protein product [Linum tenue]|uniref:Xylanase inhibitor N-terminal domain-containing protein n=1 Tax=Linum tenue TaxID=586396 RepID=A0AAV0I4P8_9ROSI|nr:unnamed protein product [Linum tenue]
MVLDSVCTYQSGTLGDSALAVDGIFGLGQGPLSPISQLASRGVIPPVFSHCLKGEGLGGGTFVLGEISEPGIVYTPMVPAQPHYNIYLQSITVNGELLPVDPAVFATSTGRGTFVDSLTFYHEMIGFHIYENSWIGIWMLYVSTTLYDLRVNVFMCTCAVYLKSFLW